VDLYKDRVKLQCQLCGVQFTGPAYGYPSGRWRVGCYCDPLCGYRALYDSDDRRKEVSIPQVRGEGGKYLLPPPRLLKWFGGPLTYDEWKRDRSWWVAPECPYPRHVVVETEAAFSSIKKPRRKLGRKLFDTASGK